MHFGVKTQIQPKWTYVVYDLDGSISDFYAFLYASVYEIND